MLENDSISVRNDVGSFLLGRGNWNESESRDINSLSVGSKEKGQSEMLPNTFV